MANTGRGEVGRPWWEVCQYERAGSQRRDGMPPAQGGGECLAAPADLVDMDPLGVSGGGGPPPWLG